MKEEETKEIENKTKKETAAKVENKKGENTKKEGTQKKQTKEKTKGETKETKSKTNSEKSDKIEKQKDENAKKEETNEETKETVKEEVEVKEKVTTTGSVEAQVTKETKKGGFFKENKKVLIIIAIILVAVILLAVAFKVVMQHINTVKMDVQKYVTVDATGYSGYATATTGYDSVYLSELKLKNDSQVDRFIDSISVTLDKTEEISNGDELHVIVNYNEELAKELKIKILNREFMYKIENLPESEVVDIFENIKVTFEGYSPMLIATLENNSENSFIKENISFKLDKTKNIKLGEEVTVTASYDDEYLKQNGIIIEQNTKKYKAEKAAKYISSLEEITEDYKKQIDAKLQDKLDELFSTPPPYTALGWANKASYIYYHILEDTSGNFDRSLSYKSSLQGRYLLTLKEASDKKEYNQYYNLYKVDFVPHEGKTGKGTVYVLLKAKNIIVDTNGELTFDCENASGLKNISKLVANLERDYIDVTKGKYNLYK